MPVVSGGVLYRNMYCAACHGLPLHQLEPATSYNVACFEGSRHVDSSLLLFVINFDCNVCQVTMPFKLKSIERYGDACWCHQALPDRFCSNLFFEKECSAYSKVLYDDLRQPYNNQVCMECDNDGVANVSRPDHCKLTGILRVPVFNVDFFHFTGMSFLPVYKCKEYYNKGRSGNPCLVKRCQHGFEIHDDTCMSIITARVCYPPQQNRHNSDFLIANLFRSAIIIHYKATDVKEAMLYKTNPASLEKSKPCTHLPILYKRLLPQDLIDSIECALLYFDSIAFAKLSVDLSIRDLSKKIISWLGGVPHNVTQPRPFNWRFLFWWYPNCATDTSSGSQRSESST